MTLSAPRADGAAPLPASLAALDLLHIESAGAVLHIRLGRPAKRNAINDALVAQLHTAFVNLPEATARGRAERRGRSLLRRARPLRGLRAQRRRGHRPLALVARGLRADPVRPRAGRRGAARRRRRRRPRAGERLPCARRRGERVLRPARRPARPVRRRRRLGAHPAPDRRRAHDRHDADRPRLRRGGGLGDRHLAVPGRGGPGPGDKAFALRRAHRRQRAAVELRRHARLAAHRRHGAGRRPVRRVADGRDRLGRRGGQEPRARLPRRPGGEGEEGG